MAFSIIACIGKNRELGKDNDLVFHFKEDMRFFRETTRGHAVAMGYNTWLSIGERPLPGRKNIVFSRRDLSLPEGVEQVRDLIGYIGANRESDEEVFIIGGAKIYREFLPYANTLYLTEVDAEADAEVYFPEFDAADFDVTELAHFEENGTKFVINKYTRR